MVELLKFKNWIAGLQWLFFIFTNIVVIPITVGAAFDLSPERTVSLIQLSFVVTGLACVFQALLGHNRAIMEGQSGLWWGVFLALVATGTAQGTSLAVIGGSLTVGVIISGIITIIVGLSGLGPLIAKLFNPAVMGVFIFLLGCQLVGIFLQGMLGIPFGANESGQINLAISLLSIIVVIIVIVISIKAPPSIKRYSLLIGIIIGWIAYTIFFGSPKSDTETTKFSVEYFLLGRPAWDVGIILTAVIAGLLNLANSFGSLKGTDSIYDAEATNREYRSSLTITGLFNGIAGIFGLVPYAPYVSSIAYLNQTGIITRLPFILGGSMFVVLGLIPSLGAFFSKLPLSIGSAVLFVAYVLLFKTSWDFFEQVHFTTENVYRSAIPIFVGIIIMTMPASYFETIPSFIRPLLSNGLLMGILLALLLENLFSWDYHRLNQNE